MNKKVIILLGIVLSLIIIVFSFKSFIFNNNKDIEYHEDFMYAKNTSIGDIKLIKGYINPKTKTIEGDSIIEITHNDDIYTIEGFFELGEFKNGKINFTNNKNNSFIYKEGSFSNGLLTGSGKTIVNKENIKIEKDGNFKEGALEGLSSKKYFIDNNEVLSINGVFKNNTVKRYSSRENEDSVSRYTQRSRAEEEELQEKKIENRNEESSDNLNEDINEKSKVVEERLGYNPNENNQDALEENQNDKKNN